MRNNEAAQIVRKHSVNDLLIDEQQYLSRLNNDCYFFVVKRDPSKDRHPQCRFIDVMFSSVDGTGFWCQETSVRGNEKVSFFVSATDISLIHI